MLFCCDAYIDSNDYYQYIEQHKKDFNIIDPYEAAYMVFGNYFGWWKNI
jgi:hypothetical protein